MVTEETPFEKGAPPRLFAEGLSLIKETDLSTVRDAKASFSLAGIPKLKVDVSSRASRVAVWIDGFPFSKFTVTIVEADVTPSIMPIGVDSLKDVGAAHP